MMLCSAALGLLLLSPQGDAQARAVYDAWISKLGTTKSYSGSVELAPPKAGAEPTVFKFKLLKPNLFKVSSNFQEWQSDGTDMYVYMPDRKQFMKQKLSPRAPLTHGFETFFEELAKDKQPTEFKMGTFDGKPVAMATSHPQKELDITVMLDPQSKTPVAWEQVYAKSKNIARYKDLVADAKLEAAEFAWNPGPDVKPYEQPDFKKSLLKVGAVAPDFTLDTNDGKKVSLKESLKGKKAVLLNFWFYG